MWEMWSDLRTDLLGGIRVRVEIAEHPASRRNAAVVAVLLGVTALAGLEPSSATSAGPTSLGTCEAVERMVWTGDDSSARRQVAVGTPGNAVPFVASAGLSTANGDPSVSPDGRHVAWVGLSTVSGVFEAFVADADGRNGRALAPGRPAASTLRPVAAGGIEVGVTPAWSPESARLAWASADRTSVTVAALDGSGALSLGTRESQVVGPLWSPDGTRIAWANGEFGSAPLKVSAVSATARSRTLVDDLYLAYMVSSNDLPTTNGLPTTYAWAPDGSGLAVVHASDGYSAEVALVGLGGTVARMGRMGVGDLFYPIVDNPRWSPDGRILAWTLFFSGLVPGGLLGESGTYGVTSLFRVNGLQVWFPDRDPAWSPSGTRLLTADWKWGSAVLGEWAHGTVNERLPGGFVVAKFSGPPANWPNVRVDLKPSWSPDGTAVAWQSGLWKQHPNWYFPGGRDVTHLANDIAVAPANRPHSGVVLGPGANPVWSRSGALVASSFDGALHPEFWEDWHVPASIRAYPADGSAPTVFTGPIYDVRGPVAWTSTAAADLSLAVRAPASVAWGDSMSVEVAVTNAGPCDATGVHVSGVWPVNRPATFAPDSGWARNGNWWIPRLAAGASAHLRIDATISGSGETVAGDLAAWSGVDDPEQPNNALAWSVSVVGAPLPTTTTSTATTSPPTSTTSSIPGTSSTTSSTDSPSTTSSTALATSAPAMPLATGLAGVPIVAPAVLTDRAPVATAVEARPALTG